LLLDLPAIFFLSAEVQADSINKKNNYGFAFLLFFIKRRLP